MIRPPPDRLMRDLGMTGVRRGKAVRTVPGRGGNRAADLLNRDFTAAAPNTRWVADFTYVRAWAGFVYVAFIVDVFSQRLVAWHAATSKHTDLVLTPLRIATTVFHDRPYKTLADVEYATAGWVDWYNHRRLHGSLGMLTPTEYEQAHYAAADPEPQLT